MITPTLPQSLDPDLAKIGQLLRAMAKFQSANKRPGVTLGELLRLAGKQKELIREYIKLPPAARNSEMSRHLHAMHGALDRFENFILETGEAVLARRRLS